jgi:two-component system chemotaxis response regulator CheY
VAKIMVVDDAAFMRTMIKDIIISMGHEIVGEAANGEEALRLYPIIRPDLVTMDITMPVMDGVNAVREIRKIDPQARLIRQTYLLLSKMFCTTFSKSSTFCMSKTIL